MIVSIINNVHITIKIHVKQVVILLNITINNVLTTSRIVTIPL